MPCTPGERPRRNRNMKADKPQTLNSWSFSKLTEFEKCKYRTFLLHVERVPEPERPLPPGKTEHANDRGSRIHNEAELFVRSEGPFTDALSSFEEEYLALQAAFKEGRVSLEQEWGMSPDWEPTEWKTAWLRLKLDALMFMSDTHAVAIDYKTGKKFGNEVKHMEQLQLYQLVTFLRYPKLERVTVELWYLDVDELTTMEFTRPQGLRFKENFNRRGKTITSCTDWPPNPSIFTCRWCMYGPWGSDDCKVGVKR